MATRNAVLTDAQSDLVERLVSTGRYQNASEAVRGSGRGTWRGCHPSGFCHGACQILMPKPWRLTRRAGAALIDPDLPCSLVG